MFLRFLDERHTVFPFKNSQGYYCMAAERVHGVIHTPNDIPRFCHYLNSCCEAPETAHKKNVKHQGLKTNQGSEVQLTMILHSLRKECSALLCEAVQGGIHVFFTYKSYFTYDVYGM